MWVDVQKGCGMGLARHTPLRLAGNYGASRLRCLRESTHEACETVLDGSHAFLRTQYAMRRAEGAARGVTSLH